MAAPKKVTLGALIDRLHRKKLEVREAQERVKELEEEADRIKELVLEKCQEQETTQARGALAQATVTDKVLPQITDWDAFYAYIYENRFFQLLQRRPSVPACRELFDSGTQIPGVERFTKKDVSLRGL